MTADAATALRLKGMVDGVLHNSNADQRPLEAKSLADSYQSLRSEARALATDREIADEFDRLFPPMNGTPPSATGQLFEAASFANEAAALLAKLSGWLDGLVQEARLEMEARAYAEARLQQESGR